MTELPLGFWAYKGWHDYADEPDRASQETYELEWGDLIPDRRAQWEAVAQAVVTAAAPTTPPVEARFVPPSCAACGRPHKLVRKFNGGDPIEFWQDDCTCASGPLSGWGVWHTEDEEWIGWGATRMVIPDGPLYGHLQLRPARARISADPWDTYMRGEGHDLFTAEAQSDE